MIVDKFTQLNFIGDIWQPKYSTNEVYIACYKVKRNKRDIKLKFSEVGATSEYAGDWFISRKEALKCKKKFDNNGMECYAIEWSRFEPLEISERSELIFK